MPLPFCVILSEAKDLVAFPDNEILTVASLPQNDIKAKIKEADNGEGTLPAVRGQRDQGL